MSLVKEFSDVITFAEKEIVKSRLLGPSEQTGDIYLPDSELHKSKTNDKGVTVSLLISAVEKPFSMDARGRPMKVSQLKDVVLEKWTFAIDLTTKGKTAVNDEVMKRSADTARRSIESFIKQMPLSSMAERDLGSTIRVRQQIIIGDPAVSIPGTKKEEKPYTFSCSQGTFGVTVSFVAMNFSTPNALENLFKVQQPASQPEKPAAAAAAAPAPAAAAAASSSSTEASKPAPAPQLVKGPSPHSMIDPLILKREIPAELCDSKTAALFLHPQVPDEETAKKMSQEEWFTFLQSYGL